MPKETKKPHSNPIKINVDEIDLESMKARTTDIPSLLRYAHTIGGFSVVPTEEGQIRSSAVSAMEDQTQMQLDQIFDQMKLLAEQANKIKSRADISYQIYNAKMSFKPLIGKTYFLYAKKEQRLLSILSPVDWGDQMPFDEFISEVKLLSDHTWKIIEQE
jgi:hypothetical protein